MSDIVQAIVDRQKSLADSIRKGRLDGGPGTLSFADRYVWPVGKDSLGIANFDAVSATDAAAFDEENHAVTCVVSTASEDRDGDLVLSKGCLLSSFFKNSVWFWGHQSWEIPIGTSKAPDGRLCVWPEENRIRAKCFFDVADPDADFILGKIRRGLINTTSIAFVPIIAHRRDWHEKAETHNGPTAPPGWVFEEFDLTEISWVGVPANANATVIRDALDKEKGYISPKLYKALKPLAAIAKGKCFTGWCPCPPREEKNMPAKKEHHCSGCDKNHPCQECAKKGLDDTFCCQECGKKFATVRAAERASMNGCPKCGSTDIDLCDPKIKAAKKSGIVVIKGKWTTSNTNIETWFERDRAHVDLQEASTGRTIVEWWDEDVNEAIEDGFLNRSRLHASAVEYANMHGMKSAKRKSPPVQADMEHAAVKHPPEEEDKAVRPDNEPEDPYQWRVFVDGREVNEFEFEEDARQYAQEQNDGFKESGLTSRATVRRVKSLKKEQPSSDIDSDKACKILEDGTVNGKPLTEDQRGMFGAACGRNKGLWKPSVVKGKSFAKCWKTLGVEKLSTNYKGYLLGTKDSHFACVVIHTNGKVLEVKSQRARTVAAAQKVFGFTGKMIAIKSLNESSGTAGGYTVPEEMKGELEGPAFEPGFNPVVGFNVGDKVYDEAGPSYIGTVIRNEHGTITVRFASGEISYRKEDLPSLRKKVLKGEFEYETPFGTFETWEEAAKRVEEADMDPTKVIKPKKKALKAVGDDPSGDPSRKPVKVIQRTGQWVVVDAQGRIVMSVGSKEEGEAYLRENTKGVKPMKRRTKGTPPDGKQPTSTDQEHEAPGAEATSTGEHSAAESHEDVPQEGKTPVPPFAKDLAHAHKHLKALDDWMEERLPNHEPEAKEAYSDMHQSLKDLIQGHEDAFSERYPDHDMEKALGGEEGGDENLEGEEGMVNEGDVPPDDEKEEEAPAEEETEEKEEDADIDVDDEQVVSKDDEDPRDEPTESSEEILERYRKPKAVKAAAQVTKMGSCHKGHYQILREAGEHMDNLANAPDLPPVHKGGLLHHSDELGKVCKELETMPGEPDDEVTEPGGEEMPHTPPLEPGKRLKNGLGKGLPAPKVVSAKVADLYTDLMRVARQRGVLN